MNNTTLIGNDVTRQEPLCNAIRKWFQENGTIAFEHGFKSDTIRKNNVEYHISMCDSNGVHVRPKHNNSSTTFSWYVLPKQTILKVIRECNRYYQYCLTQA